MTCHFKDHILSNQTLCIRADLSKHRFSDFWQDVCAQLQLISRLKADIWATWQPDSYQFLVTLFAGLLAKKELIITPHRVKSLEQTLAQDGIFFIQDQLPTEPHQAESNQLNQHQHRSNVLKPDQLQLDDQFLNRTKLYFYTSGSTGEPKKIPRTLKQLLNEVQSLDAENKLDPTSVAIVTVAHQHLYGLLFKLLWPLATGRAFYNSQLAFPEAVLEIQQRLSAEFCCNQLVSSPAILKRWTADVQLINCSHVFSSGGKLDRGVRALLNVNITEIYGSSETGGIGYRTSDDGYWRPFPSVQIAIDHSQLLKIKSAHAYHSQWMTTDDRIALVEPDHPPTGFELLGRADRIIKLEEKRLSLDEIERQIASLDEIAQCHCFINQQQNRQILACVAELTTAAMQQLKCQTKLDFVNQIKTQLRDKLEIIAIPKQWRFLSQLPHNAQSKLNVLEMKNLINSALMPVILEQQQQPEQATFKLEFSAELSCFKGHFQDFAVYPGVGQISFIQHFATNCWSDLAWCNGYEQLKFMNLIRPFDVLSLSLKRQQYKIEFKIYDKDQTIASGRLRFECKPNTARTE